MTLIYFILILGITVTVHEFGHFLFAKKAGIYVYEFSIGMGPLIYKFKRKNDETTYSIRLFPIGGYVQMSGEEVEEDISIPKEKRMQSKTLPQRFLTVIAGVTFNFILSLIILFIVGLFVGYSNPKVVIKDVLDNSPAQVYNLEKNDEIIAINGHKANTFDRLNLELAILKNDNVTFKILRDGKYYDMVVKPNIIDNTYYFGFTLNSDVSYGLLPAIKYAFYKFGSLFEQFIKTLLYLFTGNISFDALSGPVGIYQIVDKSAQMGFINLIYLLAYISLNVGVVNLIPLPAFDGGRAFFMIIEAIRGKKINPKVENMIHAIGLVVLLILMGIITIKDLIKLF